RPSRMRLGPGGQARHGLGDGGGALEVEGHLAPADAVEVGVAVGEAGAQNRALEVEILGVFYLGGAGGRADVEDPAVLDDDHLGGRLVSHAGVDGPAVDQQFLGLGAPGGRSEEQGEGEGEGTAHLTVPESGGLRTRLTMEASSSSRSGG